MSDILFVGLGGFAGSVLRFLVGLALKDQRFMNFPLSTFAVNVAGSFVIGFFIASWAEVGNLRWFYFMVPGVLGGFTTFSTFSAEAFMLMKQQGIVAGATYMAASFIIGLLATGSGFYLSKKIFL